MTQFIPHVQRHGDDVLNEVLNLHPSKALAINPDVKFWSTVLNQNPNLGLIARYYGARWDSGDTPWSRIQSNWHAEELASSYLQWCVKQPSFSIVKFITTPVMAMHQSHTRTQLLYYDHFMSVLVKSMWQLGKEVIVGNFGTGNFTAEMWLDIFPKTSQNALLFGFQEYGWPSLSSQVSSPSSPYHALRCVEIMKSIRKVNPAAKAIITECGITNAVIPGEPDVGYKTIKSAGEYWKDLKWYIQALSQYEWITDAAPFLFGANSDWPTFDIVGTPIVEQMQQWNHRGEIKMVGYSGGFKELVDVVGRDTIGDAVTNEVYLGVGPAIVLQTTTKGLLVYGKDSSEGAQFIAHTLSRANPNP